MFFHCWRCCWSEYRLHILFHQLFLGISFISSLFHVLGFHLRMDFIFINADLTVCCIPTLTLEGCRFFTILLLSFLWYCWLDVLNCWMDIWCNILCCSYMEIYCPFYLRLIFSADCDSSFLWRELGSSALLVL